jgi:putative Ca2+/H+ antiporter (TMEM165/GDT1 family)
MLTAFTASLMLITAAEFGDKTFFVALILAMRHIRERWLVFWGVLAGLALMTGTSVLAGNLLATVPRYYVHYGEVALFVCFGVKLLYDASQMSAHLQETEQREAEDFINRADISLSKRQTRWRIFREAFVLTFLAEWGDRTQITTIALAAAYHPSAVIVGSIVGHSVCTAIAVLGGRLMAKRISEQAVTALGGILYLIFAIVAWFEP